MDVGEEERRSDRIVPVTLNLVSKMSVCMRSAKCVPTGAARLLAKKFGGSTSTSSGMLTSKGRCRWNSSKAGSLEARLAKGKGRGWTSLSVLSLVATTGVCATAFASYQADSKRVRLREYSSPEKWNQPKYATIKDMEAVSGLDLKTAFKFLHHEMLREEFRASKRHSHFRVN
jgi:hypothetical protein